MKIHKMEVSFSERLTAVIVVLILSCHVVLAAGIKIGIASDSDVGLGGKWTKARCEEWAKQTGNEVQYVNLPPSANDVLQLFSQYWAARSPEVDIYQIDVAGLV
jgi:hypothetical protein